MSRGWKVALGIVVAVLLILTAVTGYGLWVWLFRESGLDRMRAGNAMSSGDYERAAELYEKALQRRPDDASLHMDLARALEEDDKPTQAVEHYREAARLQPEGTRALLQVTRLELEADRPAEAEAAARQAMERDDEGYRPPLALGLALAAQGRHEEALEQYELAMDRDAPLRHLAYNMGMSHEALGDMAAAIEIYRIGADKCDFRASRRLEELEVEEEEIPGDLALDGIEEEYRGDVGEPGGWFFALFMIAYLGFIGLYMLLYAAGWIAAIYFLWDCAQRAFPEASTRGAWCIVLFVVHLIGAIIYYFAVYRPNRPPRLTYQPRPPTGQAY